MNSKNWALSGSIAAALCVNLCAARAEAQQEEQWTDRIALKGDLRLRYEAIDEEGEENRDRERYRARIALTANVSDQVRFIAELASGADDPVSRNQTFDGGFTTKDFGLDLVYVDWTVNDTMHLFGGKMHNPLFRAGGLPLIWDSDLNPEGVALHYDSGMFFGTLAGFAVEERSSSDDSLLVAAQGGVRFDFRDSARLTVGIGYYDYSNTIGNEPFYNGDPKGNSVDAAGDLVFDYNELEAFAQYDMTVGNLPFSVFADYVQNNEVDANDIGYAFGFKAGKASGPGTWEAGWAYQDVEADAVIATFNDSDFGGGGTDATGHILKARYAYNKNIAFAGTLFLNKVADNAGNEHDYSRLQLDLEFKFN